jgi:hypothetical protein
MTSTNQGLDTIQNALPKVISPKVHGFIDYAHAAFFFTVGVCCARSNKRAATAAFATSGFILVQSLLTDYPLGARPVISFESHGKMDAAFVAASPAIPKLLGFSGSIAAKIFQANALAEALVVGMTDWSSDNAHQDRLLAEKS